MNAVSGRIRFGVFELDLKAGELHKSGHKIRLQEQPFQILRMLVEHAGEVVAREEIQSKLWPNDTVVEFDHGINTAIRKLRIALDNDDAETPSYIETVARRGYRLIMPVEWPQSSSDGGARDAAAADGPPVSVGEGADAKPQRSAAPTPGKTVSHYRVLNVIGGGGMGVVYRAEDLRLGRAVALKFLPEELGSDPVALGRFEREAQTASSLNHPNICTIYEVDEHEETPFIVMEYLEGMTLRDVIVQASIASPLTKSRKPPMSIEDVLDVATQIAAGLEAAHQKGIIHRDIKPANIFVTRQRQVKILDFGLAKLITTTREIASDRLTRDGRAEDPEPAKERSEPDLENNLTRAGASLGTTGYMSPEQVEGLKLDARTDLFCFGLVLYELTTGKRAFGGGTKESFREAVLHEAPVPMHELNPLVPPKLEAIITRCLEKDRNQRYQDASDLRNDLKQMRREMSALQLSKALVAERIAEATKKPPPPASEEITEPPERRPRTKWIVAVLIAAVALMVGIRLAYRAWHPSPVEANASIAVLPFTDMSTDKGEEYFSDGLTEQLINDLVHLQGMKVIARSSAFQFKGKTIDARAVGRELNVATILEGSVRRDGDRVRINVELTKASDGFQLWSQSYDRQIGDIFAVQDEIARSVANELQLKLTGSNGASLVRSAGTTTPDAYQAFLEGQYFWHRHQPDDYETALPFAEQAISLDPKYAPAWALRSRLLTSLALLGKIDNQEGIRKARESAQAAIGLDPNLADAYLALVRIEVYHDFDLKSAEATLNKAAELDPGSADVYKARSVVLGSIGRLDQALEAAKKTLLLDPLSAYGMIGGNLYHQGRYPEAAAALKKDLELNPQQRFAHFELGAISLAQGRSDEALGEMQQEVHEAAKLVGEIMVYHATGRHQDSDTVLNELITKHQKDSPYQIAEAYSYRDETEKSFAWLERAYEQRDGGMLNLKIDPLLTNLHQDPRYTELLNKMRLQ